MNSPLKVPALLRLSCLVFASAGAAAAQPGVRLGAENAALVSLSLEGAELSLAGQGGFHLYDATDRKDVTLAPGTLTEARERTAFACEGPDVRLRAEFLPQGDYVLVRGELENLRGDDRGFIVDYRIPPLSPNAVFSNGLEQSIPMAGSSETEGNVFPVAAMTGQDGGVAMAIPPSEPRVFGLAGAEAGLTMRFYLGTSPQPRRFPNRASFVFILYRTGPAPRDAAPGDGFRSALSRYYRFFPDYYAPRLKHDGLWMFQMADRIPPNVGQYGFDEIEPLGGAATIKAVIARDKPHEIAIFPYTIVGEREIKFLPELPKDYDDAMAILSKWTLSANTGHAVTKESVDPKGDVNLKEEIESSACQTSDGRYALVFRKTPWGGNSITYKINPNPDLELGGHRHTVGGDTLELVRQWLEEYPDYDGAYVDSLGANWPAVLNYARNQFTEAHFPLTVDQQGRVALQNDLSHYEFLEALRAQMRASNRMVFGNGIYAYKSRGQPGPRVERQTFDKQFNEYMAGNTPPEHYHPGTRLGRFFDAALLDVAGSEAGVEATVERCQDVRSFLGQKPYAFLNYRWDDAAPVAELINKSLCFGIFATSTRNFMTHVRYEDNPNGYLRDKPLIDWFVPLVRQLSHAGWEPVRHAVVEGSSVSCERFGGGGTVFYTLYNDSHEKETAVLKVDLESLGFTTAHATFSEIARHSPVRPVSDGAVAVELNPKETSVIRIARGLSAPSSSVSR